MKISWEVVIEFHMLITSALEEEVRGQLHTGYFKLGVESHKYRLMINRLSFKAFAYCFLNHLMGMYSVAAFL
jgi:hypothetical protein